MKDRRCVVNPACGPLTGWEAFLTHIYLEHTDGPEEARLDQLQAHLERRAARPPELRCDFDCSVCHEDEDDEITAEDVQLAADVAVWVRERDSRCPGCTHPSRLHDEEGCTVTIPQTEDPDFGPTQTCPCCAKGPR